MASNGVCGQGNDVPSASSSTAPTVKTFETAETRKVSSKKRSTGDDVEAPIPKKKPVKAKAGITNASKAPKSLPLKAKGEARGDKDDEEYTDFEDMNEDDDFKSLIKKVRRECKLPKSKSNKDEVLVEVGTLVRESLDLVIRKHNPDDAAKFQNFNHIKQFEFVCKPSGEDGVIAKNSIAILRKRSQVIFGRFQYTDRGMSLNGTLWKPIVEFRIDRKGDWRLYRAVLQGWQQAALGGIWGAFYPQLYPDQGVPLHKQRAIPTVMRAVKDILEVKHWVATDFGSKAYDINCASSTSTSYARNDMWEGERYKPPFPTGRTPR